MSDEDDNLLPNAKGDEADLKEAKTRFAYCEDRLSHAYNGCREDYRFGHADDDNQAQWPDQLITQRDIDDKPMLTVNKTRVHCLQVINDAKQNKAGIVVHPTTNEATFEAAQVYEDVVRHIEYMSRAQEAYDHASDGQVYMGLGYCRVLTEYADKDSFDQEIRIKRVEDPLSVMMDPDAVEGDKSDSEFGFSYDDMSHDRFKIEHPGHDDALTSSSGLGSYDNWIAADHIRVAEYWRRKHKAVTLVSVVDPSTGERRTAPKSSISVEMLRAIKKDPQWAYRERDSDEITVECIKIAGSKIIDRYDWLGDTIPFVPCIGEWAVIDGQIEIKGLVRYLKGPQRVYNYNTSASVEAGALQTKTPWMGPAEAFEGYEEYYEASNRQNLAYLPYKHRDDAGQEIDAPKRVDPPRLSEVFLKGMEIAEREMMMATGQYQSQFGEKENATSGKAINERQRQGDNATYHFVDGHAMMVRGLGRIVVDLIPKVMDTKRIMRIRGEDGITKNITFDPKAQQAVQQQKMQDKQQVEIIFNPNVGKFAVEVDIGPSYATRRQEAWNAIIQILTQSPALIPVVGDLLFQNADFPGADEIAQRLRRMAPPQALGDAPPPADQQMQQHIGQLTQLIGELNGKLSDRTAEINIKAFEASTKAFDSMTKRLQAIGNAGPIVSAEQEQPLIASTLGGMESNPVPSPQPMGGQPPMGQPMPQGGAPQLMPPAPGPM